MGSTKDLKDKGSTRVLAMGVTLAMSMIFSSLICLGAAVGSPIRHNPL
jgi:hypothetical protein